MLSCAELKNAEKKIYDLMEHGYMYSVVLLASAAYELRELQKAKSYILGAIMDEKSVIEDALDMCQHLYDTVPSLRPLISPADKGLMGREYAKDLADMFKARSEELDYLCTLLAEGQEEE